jgi:copper chaperone CopZ
MKLLIFLFSLFATTNASDTKKICLSIKGMYCSSCRQKIESSLLKTKSTKMIAISTKKETGEIEYYSDRINREKIIQTIEELGYKPKEEKCSK